MDTSQTIQRLLTTGQLAVQAFELAAEHEVETLAPKLKALYESTFGATLLKAEEWIEQAVALKLFHAQQSAAVPPEESHASAEVQPHEISTPPDGPSDHPAGDDTAHDAHAAAT